MAEQRGISNDGINWAADTARGAAIAVAFLNTQASLYIASEQEKLANDYLNIAKEQNQYYYNLYVPCENIEVTEACDVPLYQEHIDVNVGRMLNTVRHQFAGKIEKELECISRYCTGKKAAIIKDLIGAQSSAAAAAGNLGRRYEETFADAQDDLRWARRAQALARGRDMMSQAVTFSGFAYGLFGRLGQQVAMGAEGALNYLGYVGQRLPTTYPTRSIVQYPVSRPLQPVTSYPVPTPDVQSTYLTEHRIRG